MLQSGEWAGRRKASRRLHQAAKRAFDGAVKAGIKGYDRLRDLPGLIRLDPFVPVADTTDAIEGIVARLESALRAERKRAGSGHWTYDLNRHIALHQAHRAESERLAKVKAGRQARPT